MKVRFSFTAEMPKNFNLRQSLDETLFDEDWENGVNQGEETPLDAFLRQLCSLACDGHLDFDSMQAEEAE